MINRFFKEKIDRLNNQIILPNMNSIKTLNVSHELIVVLNICANCFNDLSVFISRKTNNRVLTKYK